jgi:hypothetical protein
VFDSKYSRFCSNFNSESNSYWNGCNKRIAKSLRNILFPYISLFINVFNLFLLYFLFLKKSCKIVDLNDSNNEVLETENKIDDIIFYPWNLSCDRIIYSDVEK